MFDDDVRRFAESSVLCWLATIDTHGWPNVSPKEMFILKGGSHVVIANIASPVSVRNVNANSRVCVSFIDVFVQKGYKVWGHARYLDRNSPEFSQWSKELCERAEPKFRIHGVIVIAAERLEPIVAPSYRFHSEHVSEGSQVAEGLARYRVRPL